MCILPIIVYPHFHYMASTTLYILRLEDQCRYVGRTAKLRSRLRQHRHPSPRSVAWVLKHPFVAVERVIHNANPFDEDRYVKEYMSIYGIDKVRGGVYSNVSLHDDQVKLLQREIWHAQGKCIKCGKHGHYMRQCKVDSLAASHLFQWLGTKMSLFTDLTTYTSQLYE